jgi:hypothetical protein
VFPTAKYRLVRERLIAAGVIAAGDVVRPEPATDAEVRLVHDAAYVDKINRSALSLEEQVVLEVPFSAALRNAAWMCAGGTIRAGRLALERGAAVHLGGGFHHAFPDHGEGFCLINDVAIACEPRRRKGASAALRSTSTCTTERHRRDLRDDLCGSLRSARRNPPPSSRGRSRLTDTGRAGRTSLRFRARAATWATLIHGLRRRPITNDRRRLRSAPSFAERDRSCSQIAAGIGAATLASGYARRVEDTVAIHADMIEEVSIPGATDLIVYLDWMPGGKIKGGSAAIPLHQLSGPTAPKPASSRSRRPPMPGQSDPSDSPCGHGRALQSLQRDAAPVG